MNNLRTPFAVLCVVVLVLLGWFIWVHDATNPAPVVSQTQNTATIPMTTEPSQQRATTSAPTLDPTVVAQNVVGSWLSNDDPNYSVAITASGSWTDTYEGADASSGVSETGTYTIFTSQNPDKNFTGFLVPGVIYVKVAEGKTVSYFSVLEANGTQLQLSYLDRGTTLSFVKAQ